MLWLTGRVYVKIGRQIVSARSLENNKGTTRAPMTVLEMLEHDFMERQRRTLPLHSYLKMQLDE